MQPPSRRRASHIQGLEADTVDQETVGRLDRLGAIDACVCEPPNSAGGEGYARWMRGAQVDMSHSKSIRALVVTLPRGTKGGFRLRHNSPAEICF